MLCSGSLCTNVDIDIEHDEDVKRVTSISQGSAIELSSAAEVKIFLYHSKTRPVVLTQRRSL